ncbi:MAG: hypothetical protein JXR64_03475 [Spirochaetales bacterium]|nr:hypothetical protein [Spirochaetales bacterium]
MPKYDKGENLLQYLKLLIAIILLVSLSCTSLNRVDNEVSQDIANYFSGDLVDEWLYGLSLFEKNRDKIYINSLVSIYLDNKFEEIEPQLKSVLIQYFNSYTYDFITITPLFDTPEKIDKFSNVFRGFSIENKVLFFNSIYTENSVYKSKFIEVYSKHLTIDLIDELYRSSVKGIQLGAIYSAGYITGSGVLDWLEDKLKADNDEILSATILSLSKQGQAGFLIISRNLINLPDRLKITVIDLLTFNKITVAYDYYVLMLENSSKLVSDRILLSFKNIGLKAVPYLIDALIIGNKDLAIPILDILSNIDGAEYLIKTMPLLLDENLHDYLIKLYFKEEALNILEDLIINNSYNIENKTIKYGFDIRSDLFFRDKNLSNHILGFFLTNYSLDDVVLYLRDIGRESKYIEDYRDLVEINYCINNMMEIESLNGEIDYITSFFEIEKEKVQQEKESELFFDGMEKWLETGDKKYLNDSENIKKNNAGLLSIEDKKSKLYNSLSESDRDVLILYERNRTDLVSRYRSLTFRLKDYGRNLIIRNGYFDLIK